MAWRSVGASMLAIIAGAIVASQSVASQKLIRADALVIPVFARPEAALASVQLRENARQQFDAPRKVAATAQMILAETPLSAGALLAAAMAHQQLGETAKADRLAAMAERVSARYAPAQLWLAEGKFKANRPVDAMRHVDRALRSQPERGLPILERVATALRDPAVRTVVGRQLAANPPWQPRLLAMGSARPEVAAPMAEMLSGLPRRSDTALPAWVAADLVRHLADQNQATLLRRVYPKISPVGSRAAAAALAPAELAVVSGHPPVAWWVTNAVRYGASVAVDEKTGGLTVEAWADPANSGVAARKLVWLEPGRSYGLKWQVSRREVKSEGASARWILRCASGSPASAAQSETDDLLRGQMSGSMSFVPPSGCNAAMLELLVSGSSDGGSPVSLVLVGVALKRLQR